MAGMELDYVLQGEGATCVCMQYEEVCDVGRANLLTEDKKATCCSKGSVFLQVSARMRFNG
jgi:hypothetical protein